MRFDFRRRYDNLFGRGTFAKLIDARKKYSNDVYIRVNVSKISCLDVEKFLKKNRVKFSKSFLPNCYKIEKSFFNLSSSLLALTGKIYIQDIASQIPVNCIDFVELKKLGRKVRILDACASPGSKTTQLCDLLCFHGIDYELVALEPEGKRLRRLLNNIQKQGFGNVTILKQKAESFKSREKFDVVLLDVPCSGNLVGDSDWLNKRDLNGIRRNASLQREILKNSVNLVSDSGVIVYSTCSIEPEENEENIEFAIKKLGLKSFKPDLKLPFNANSENNSLRFMPYVSKTQGFFVCCFRKS